VCWLSISYNTLFYFWCNIGATIPIFHLIFYVITHNMRTFALVVSFP